MARTLVAWPKVRSLRACEGARLARRGYTLIELLVAMGLGALLLSAVLAAFLSSSRLMSWIGTRTDVASSALLGLNQLASDVRGSAYETITVEGGTALACNKQDDSTINVNTFTPSKVFIVYWFDVKRNLFMRKTWDGTQPSSLLPDPFTVGRLSLVPDQLSAVLAQTNGTEHAVAANVNSVVMTPATFPCAASVNGFEVTLQVQATAPNGQTCEETVKTLVRPRNHP